MLEEELVAILDVLPTWMWSFALFWFLLVKPDWGGRNK